MEGLTHAIFRLGWMISRVGNPKQLLDQSQLLLFQPPATSQIWSHFWRALKRESKGSCRSAFISAYLALSCTELFTYVLLDITTAAFVLVAFLPIQ